MLVAILTTVQAVFNPGFVFVIRGPHAAEKHILTAVQAVFTAGFVTRMVGAGSLICLRRLNLRARPRIAGETRLLSWKHKKPKQLKLTKPN